MQCDVPIFSFNDRLDSCKLKSTPQMGYQGNEKGIQMYWKSIITNVNKFKKGRECLHKFSTKIGKYILSN